MVKVDNSMKIPDVETLGKHDATVRLFAEWYKEEGFQVMSSVIENMGSPPLIGSQIPDIYAIRDGKEIVVEVLVRECRGRPGCEATKEAFRTWAESAEGRLFKHVII